MIDKIALWWLIGMSLLNMLLVVALIGKPRKPISPTHAGGMIFWSLLYVAAYIHILGNLK